MCDLGVIKCSTLHEFSVVCAKLVSNGVVIEAHTATLTIRITGY